MLNYEEKKIESEWQLVIVLVMEKIFKAPLSDCNLKGLGQNMNIFLKAYNIAKVFSLYVLMVL